MGTIITAVAIAFIAGFIACYIWGQQVKAKVKEAEDKAKQVVFNEVHKIKDEIKQHMTDIHFGKVPPPPKQQKG